MVISEIARFQVWLVQLNPAKGQDINNIRPCIVVSPNEMFALSTVLIAPMSTNSVALPCRVECKFGGKKGLVILDQIRAVEKVQLMKNLGMLDDITQIKLTECLQEIFTY